VNDQAIIDRAKEIGIRYIILDRDAGLIDCPFATDNQISLLFGWLAEHGEMFEIPDEAA